MPILGRQLADGQLPATEIDLYTAPGGNRVFIKSIICANTHAATTNTIEVFLRPSGGISRRLFRVPLSANEQLFFNEARVLDAGDAIRGLSSTTGQVDYTIDGATEVV